MDADSKFTNVNILPPFSIAFSDALREFRQKDARDHQIEKPIIVKLCVESPLLNKKVSDDVDDMKCSKAVLDEDAVTLFPRRKAGQSRNDANNRKPLKLSVEVLETFYGMPLHIAARQLVRMADQ